MALIGQGRTCEILVLRVSSCPPKIPQWRQRYQLNAMASALQHKYQDLHLPLSSWASLTGFVAAYYSPHALDLLHMYVPGHSCVALPAFRILDVDLLHPHNQPCSMFMMIQLRTDLLAHAMFCSRIFSLTYRSINWNIP